MNGFDWALAGQIAVGIVIGVTILAAVLAYRAAKADEKPYSPRRYIG